MLLAVLELTTEGDGISALGVVVRLPLAGWLRAVGEGRVVRERSTSG